MRMSQRQPTTAYLTEPDSVASSLQLIHQGSCRPDPPPPKLCIAKQAGGDFNMHLIKAIYLCNCRRGIILPECLFCLSMETLICRNSIAVEGQGNSSRMNSNSNMLKHLNYRFKCVVLWKRVFVSEPLQRATTWMRRGRQDASSWRRHQSWH